MPKALVTGGAGFIGCELSHALVAAGYDVTAVDCLHPQVHAERVRPDRLHPSVDLVVAWDSLDLHLVMLEVRGGDLFSSRGSYTRCLLAVKRLFHHDDRG